MMIRRAVQLLYEHLLSGVMWAYFLIESDVIVEEVMAFVSAMYDMSVFRWMVSDNHKVTLSLYLDFY